MKNRYDELRRSSWSMPEGKQKLAVLEEMIRIADQYMTEEDAYHARISYFTAASEAGAQERMITAFAWCLSKYDQSPSMYSRHELMWYYKWVIGMIWRFPVFSLMQIEAVFEDFKQRCIEYGYSLRPYYHKRSGFLLSRGLTQEAAECYKQWRGASRDGLADCRACEQNAFGHYLFAANQLKKGMQAVRPILDGKMSCHSIPQATYSEVMVPLLKLKQYEEAIAVGKKAFRVIKGPQFIEEQGVFLEFFTVTDLPKAVKIYNETIRYGLESKSSWERLNYLLSVRFFLREWHKKKRRKKLVEDGRVTLAWLDQEIAAAADAFDRRNGNDYMQTYMADKEKHMNRMIDAFQLQAE
ncbi:hypothetical protein DFQ01_101351 [Paenibacillus cellulosilyticus]|uniref:Tetratricopeptide repeat protein n=1 Tax=Paenibacillus cellulosilyticus TaxID=375489 RepID=A0A2V2Z1A0_9BACL|nr:hypothetical protein [Paenibacillus cellulosilyticus]PWW08627.1 hypothetical protein DFQ01_101351 [Paenibacillus cellulosilyticus]QKS48196.1 hypothetical protein HUB94_28375 [Paenibacillus cellulosilyticus]